MLSIASGRDVGLVLDLIQDDGHLYWVRELNGDRDLVTVSTGGGPVHQLARLDDYADSLVKVGATFFYGLAASSTDTSDQRTPRYNPSKDQGGIRKVSCTQ